MKQYTPKTELLNHLILTLAPLFFSYPEQEQNKRRQQFYMDHYEKVSDFLYRELFSLRYDAELEEDSPLESEQQHLFNAYTTALSGIGDNKFKLCEFQASDFNLSAYQTVYDYDLQDFEYQQQAIKEHASEVSHKQEYRLYLNHNWVRMLDDAGNFYYGTHSSLAYYLSDALEESMKASIQTLIPNTLIEGPNHGKQVDGGELWDFITEAGGLEAEVEELESRGRQYIREAYERLSEAFHASTSNDVYFEKHADDIHGPFLDVIINNAATAKKITFMHFLKDCEKYLKPNENLAKLKEQETVLLKQFILDAHQDILKNFDPKVVISPDALDGLSHLGHDE